MKRELIQYLSDILKRSLDFVELMKAQETGLTEAWTGAQAVFDDQFISTADEYGIARYEGILGITPDAESTLDERREVVLGRWRGRTPPSLATIQAICDALCPGQLEAGYDNGYVILWRTDAPQTDHRPVAREILHDLPANLAVTVGARKYLGVAVTSIEMHMGDILVSVPEG